MTDGRSMSDAAPPVVVVDDDELARELVARLLQKLALVNPLVFAEDGDRAVDLLSTGPMPALVLLDLDMPRRSGLEVLAWLRSDARLRRIPVIMLTGSAELEEVDRAYELGITSYLVKPVGFSALRDVMRDLAAPWVLLPPP